MNQPLNPQPDETPGDVQPVNMRQFLVDEPVLPGQLTPTEDELLFVAMFCRVTTVGRGHGYVSAFHVGNQSFGLGLAPSDFRLACYQCWMFARASLATRQHFQGTV